ncbi:hypothetical protein HQ533_05345 [Candidatus Woesearchaeota archaeon]|nr:hypothetical protein [Candidatus Woesearchaeota archaeon]
MAFYELYFAVEQTFPGLLDDWYLALFLYIMITLLFGHSLEKSLEKKHIASHSIGFLLTMPVMILIFFIFYFLGYLTGLEPRLFYHLGFLIVIIIAIKRMVEHYKKKR